MHSTLDDARTAFINDGLFERADLEKEDEIIKYMFMRDCKLEDALRQLNAWNDK